MSFWDGLFSGAILVSGRVYIVFLITYYFFLEWFHGVRFFSGVKSAVFWKMLNFCCLIPWTFVEQLSQKQLFFLSPQTLNPKPYICTAEINPDMNLIFSRFSCPSRTSWCTQPPTSQNKVSQASYWLWTRAPVRHMTIDVIGWGRMVVGDLNPSKNKKSPKKGPFWKETSLPTIILQGIC